MTKSNTNKPAKTEAALTDSQLVMLSAAAARDDGAAIVPEGRAKAIALKVGASLVGRGMMQEVRAMPGWPVWRNDEDGFPLNLIVTSAGRAAIGIADEPDAGSANALHALDPQITRDADDNHLAGRQDHARSQPAQTQPDASIVATEHVGSVSPTHAGGDAPLLGRLASMAPGAVHDAPSRDATGSGAGLSTLGAPQRTASTLRPASKQATVVAMLSGDGATLDALVAATGWLPHTTRAALTGLRKKGFRIERRKTEGDSTSVYRILAAVA